MVARISLHKRGFGFVIDGDMKYFVANKNLNTAANDDLVEYRLGLYKGKQEAIVTKIIKRSKDEFVGRIINSQDFSFVESDDISSDIYIKKKDIKNAKDNDMVKVKIISFGDKKKKPEGRVIKVYGSFDNATDVVNSKIDEFLIPRKFSKEILEYTDKISKFKLEEELKKRVDLRQLDHITIDSIDTKDIDDAISLVKKDNKYILYVSIADVSHYVKEKDILDKLAKERGNSIYLYDRVIPMLPKRLTNDLCSLNENEEKLTFTVMIEYDENAKVLKSEFFKSIIISKKKCTYDEINDVLINNKEHRFYEMLVNMNKLSHKLSSLSKKRECIEFEFPELKLILDEKSQKLIDIQLRKRKDSEVLIENFMIAANEEVAKYLFYNNIPAIYRIHEKPTLESMKFLNEELKPIGLSVKNENILVNRLAKILEKLKDKPYGYYIQKLILKSMQKAIYSKDNLGHFGLSLANYLHFTSPIRRYSDLVVHRVLNESLNEYMTEFRKLKLEKKFISISKHISETERKAQKLENLAQDIKLAEYMKEHIGSVYDGYISSLANNGKLYISLETYVEAELENENNIEYNLNDKLKVVVVDTDVKSGKVYVRKVWMYGICNK